MAAPLDTLVTNRPAISAVFLNKHDESPETIGQHLFIHHALHAICQDAELDSPDEQIRGMAMGIWDGLSDRSKIFWTERAATARLVRDRDDFLLTDGSTDLARDHRQRTRTAVAEYKRSSMSDDVSIADTASVADTELTEEDIDELHAAELPTASSDVRKQSIQEPPEEVRSVSISVGRTSPAGPASDASHGLSEDVTDSNATGSDRELRELLKSDADDAALHMETPASSIESSPPAEAESPDHDPFGVPDKKSDAGDDPSTTDDSVLEPSKPERSTTAGVDVGSGSSGDPVETSDGQGLLSKITSVASSVLPWVAQSLDWAEESQEQADREAAAQPQVASPNLADEPSAEEASSSGPDHVDPAEVPSRALWVGSLQKRTTVQSLRSTFAKFGKVEFAKVIPYRACGFVNYADVESAIAAKRAMNGQRVLNAHDPLLIRFAEDRPRNGPAATKQRDVSSASDNGALSKTATAGSHDSQPERDLPPVASGNSVRRITTQEAADHSDDRSVGTATSVETRSGNNPHSFSAAQLEEARRFASQATRGGKPSKGKPVTLSVAVQKQAKKASSAAALQKGRIASGASGASGPTPRTPQEDNTPLGKPFPEKVPLAKWEEPVKVRDFGVPTSTEPEPKDEGGKGKDFFLFHALPIVCEDLEIDEPDDYAQSIASAMWLELRAEVKKNWIEDARSLRGYSVRKPGLVSAQKRFQDSHFTKDYRSQILKALAVRNNGELKYLQPEFKKLMLTERRRRRQEREKDKRQLKHAADKEAEAEEQKRIDYSATAEEEKAAREQSSNADLHLGHAEAKPHLHQIKDKADPGSPDKESPAEPELPASEQGKDTLPAPSATVVTNPFLSPSGSDPPPPYESDSGAAGSCSETANSDWQIAGQKSKSSANDPAKRAMKKLS